MDKQKNDVTPVNFKMAQGQQHTHRGVEYGEGQVIEGLFKFKADALVKMGKGQIVNGQT